MQVLENFLMGFDGSLGQKTKIITPERFASYYSNVSASIDSDDYFELVMRNVWHLSGGAGQCAAPPSPALVAATIQRNVHLLSSVGGRSARGFHAPVVTY